MNVGSLFSGIGGFDLGLERAGMRTVWFCEQDEFCQHVLAKHWPGIPCHPDITRLRGADVEPVDVLCGGFPCQDLSYAGKGAGLAGARSGLWSEYARLIGEIRPRYVLVENVAALLARGLGVVLADLAAFGYDAEWDCIPASAVGAPHRRDRVWLVAYPNGPGSQGWGLPSSDGPQVARARDDRPHSDADGGRFEVRAQLDREPLRSELTAQRRRHADRLCDDVADAEGEPLGTGLRPNEPQGLGWGRPRDVRGASVPWATEPDVGRVAHGVPARVDRLRSLGNALVPQIAEWIGGRVMAYENALLEDVAA